MGSKRRFNDSATSSTWKGRRLEPIQPTSRLIEALNCRLNLIKETLESELVRLEPNPIVDIVTAVTNVENILGIRYTSDVSSRSSSSAFCPICSQTFTRTNDVKKHIKYQHKAFQTFGEAVTCRECGSEFERPRQLVGHEKSVHGAKYTTRLEFVWPGFIQTNSEIETSRLRQFLRPGRQDSIDPRLTRYGASSSPPPARSTTWNTSNAQSNHYHSLAPLLANPAEITQDFGEPAFYDNLYQLLENDLMQSTQLQM